MVVSDDGTVVKAEDSHNHQPNPGDVKARQLRGNMRKRARDETTSMQAIYDQEKVKLLDGQWKTTVQGDRFVLGEDGDGVDKIIAFASNSALHALANADTYHMDGTFATTSRLFYQIVTLHAFVFGVMLPLVFGLLPTKMGTPTFVSSVW